jgi:serine/threonine-protein kinase HipA
MERETLVYVDCGSDHLVGRCWWPYEKVIAATFEYDKTWLAHPEGFSLEPAIKLGPGPFHAPSDQPLFGAIGDSAPDRWGRVLMRRAERRRAEHNRTTPRTLQEIDYLLTVNDESRQGALRFADKDGGPFLAERGPAAIPPLIELARLLSATEHVLADTDTEEDLRLLLAPGSSLGGARPKASIRDRDGHLSIAKFPNKGDEIRVVLWEALALTLAAKAGIQTPAWRLESAAGNPVLLLRRFDRTKGARLPFLSAMSSSAPKTTSLELSEFVDALRQHGAAPKEDMVLSFSILISNTDDHLRNQFSHTGGEGWRPAPAYDLNPSLPISSPAFCPRVSSDDGTARSISRWKWRSISSLTKGRAPHRERSGRRPAWRREAAKLGLTKAEIDRMVSAFEHEDREPLGRSAVSPHN